MNKNYIFYFFIILFITFSIFSYGEWLNHDSYYFASFDDKPGYDFFSSMVNVYSPVHVVLAGACLFIFTILFMVAEGLRWEYGVMLMFDAIILMQVQPGVLDKTIIYIPLFMILAYALINPISNTWLNKVILIIAGFGLMVSWKGSLLLFYLMFLAIFTSKKDVPKNYRYIIYSVIGIALVILFIIYKPSFRGLWDVMELRPSLFFFTGMYLLYAFMTTILFMTQKHDRKTVVWLVVFLVPGLLFFRLLPFYVIVLYMLMAKIKSLHIRRWVYLVFILSMVLSYPMYLRKPVHTPEMVVALEHVDDVCIVGDWGKGNIYTYFYNGSVVTRGHVNTEAATDIYCKGEYYNCTFMYNDEEYKRFTQLYCSYTLFIDHEPYYENDEYKLYR